MLSAFGPAATGWVGWSGVAPFTFRIINLKRCHSYSANSPRHPSISARGGEPPLHRHSTFVTRSMGPLGGPMGQPWCPHARAVACLEAAGDRMLRDSLLLAAHSPGPHCPSQPLPILGAPDHQPCPQEPAGVAPFRILGTNSFRSASDRNEWLLRFEPRW